MTKLAVADEPDLPLEDPIDEAEVPAPANDPSEVNDQALRIDRDAMLAGLRHVVDVVQSKVTIPVLGNVLLRASQGALTMRGTDLDLQVARTIPCPPGDLETTVSADRLLGAVETMRAGLITIEMEHAAAGVAAGLLLKQGRGLRRLPVIPATDFPILALPEPDVEFIMEAGALSRIRHGHIGMRDFRGEVIRTFEDAGWILHSEVCIWKDPVVAQQRTKSIRLLHKQVVKDSALSGQGLADYIVTFRKPGDNPQAIAGCFDQWIGEGEGPDPAKFTTETDGRNWYSIEVWQRYASPVWTDIRQTRVLSHRAARDEKDEQHISPLQLDVIERCIELWSNPGDTVLTPFLGIGSEVWCAVNMGRKGVGIELKPSYFQQAVRNLADLEAGAAVDLLAVREAAE